MKSCLTWEALTLQLRNPFGLSYGTTETRQSFWLRLAGDEGWGEAAIPPYYGIFDSDMVAYWQSMAACEVPWPEEPGQVAAWTGSDGPGPARCAVDLALHDRIGRRQGRPLHEVLDVPQPAALPTSFTIAIAAPDEMARLAREAEAYPILKVKLGSNDDRARLSAVRAARPDARLRVDANAGWLASDAVRELQDLGRFDIEMVEQPVAKDDFDGLAYVQAHCDLPVVADESLQSLDDLERLARAGVRAINVKLQKVGGLAPALRMLERARELEMQVMLGCMIETSLGVTAMAHLSGMAHWLDLDAPLLISNDPFDGAYFGPEARLIMPERAGIGVVRKENS